MRILALLWTILSTVPATHGLLFSPGENEGQESLAEAENHPEWLDWLDEENASGHFAGSGDHRELEMVRLRFGIFYKEVEKLCSGLACGVEAPFYNKAGKKLGTLYDTAIKTPNSLTGTMVFAFKGNTDSITLTYYRPAQYFAITGGTGKYAGASGEALVTNKPAIVVFLLNIIQ